VNIIKPESLLTLPEPQAEALMNDLSLAEQASIVLMAPWEKRQELLLYSQKSKLLVQGLPVEELFWTVKAIGPQDAIYILNLANAEQLQFLFDLDWWHKDKLRPEKIASWILLLFEAGEEAIESWLQWLMKKDKVLLPVILRPFIRIYKRPDDTDIQEAKDRLPPFTLDDLYFVFFKKEALQPIFSRFLMKILEVSPSFYRDIMETIIWESKAENIEEAFRLRRSRIGDWGLPDYYDALDIYAPLYGGLIRKAEIRSSDKKGEFNDIIPAFVPTLYIGDCPIIRTAMEKLAGTKFMERIVQEWVWAANKILIVDEVDLDDPEALHNALFKVTALINLGLEVLVKTEDRSPEDVLKFSIIEDIIRFANTLIRRLVKKARRLEDSSWVFKNFLYLPEAYSNPLRGLLFKRALFWDTVNNKYRPFCNMTELIVLENLISIVDDWIRLMDCILPQNFDWGKEINWASTNLGHPDELTLHKALLTALAQKTLDGELKVYPISAGKLNFLRKIWFRDIQGSVSDEKENFSECGSLLETTRYCVDFLQPVAEQAGLVSERLNSIVRESLMQLYEEWRYLPKNVPIDGRFVSSLIIDLEGD
jgi:hypothetical protein